MEVVSKATNVTTMAGCVACHRKKEGPTGCETCHESQSSLLSSLRPRSTELLQAGSLPHPRSMSDGVAIPSIATALALATLEHLIDLDLQPSFLPPAGHWIAGCSS